MKFATFHEWKAAHPEIVAEIKEKIERGETEPLNCTNCNGSGSCECSSCGSLHDCCECDGSGQLNPIIDLNAKLRDIYGEQMAKDKALLEKFEANAKE